MSGGVKDLESIFLAAVEIESAEARAAFLQAACTGDTGLRAEVENLLKASLEAGNFLERPVLEQTKLTELACEQQDGGKQDRATALEAGLAAAFMGEPRVVFSEGSASVLSKLEGTLAYVPRVELRGEHEPVTEPSETRKAADNTQSGLASRYQVEGEIARGGMGAILKGRDTDLGRELAIKVLLDSHKDQPEVVQRFIEEAQIGGQLQHPGIAPVYELGQFADQRPFFSMKLVKGETLSRLLADRSDPQSERTRFVGIFEQICQTMAYAHSRGVIHRDLKPANVMVGAFGEVQVMDWGLAKVLQPGDETKRTSPKSRPEHSVIQTSRSNSGRVTPGSFGSYGSQTQMGTVMGTPAYMPPEQALGEVDQLDERADVFGLGAILCEILTGQPPYVADEGTQIYRLATRGKLDDCFARLDACGADAELIALAKQCLEPDVEKRLRDAGELAERISAHIESVETRLRTSELERVAVAARAEEAMLTAKEQAAAARAERRARRMQVGFVSVVLLAVTIGGIAAVWTATYQTRLKNDAIQAEGRAEKARVAESTERERAQREESRAKEEAQRAENEKQRSDRLSAGLAFDRGLRACADGQVPEGLLWMAESLRVNPAEDADFARVVGSNISRWCTEQASLRRMIPLEHRVEAVAYSPDGRFIVAADGGTMRWFDAATGEPTGKTVKQSGEISCMAFSYDGKVLATGSMDRELYVWDVDSGTLKYPPIAQPSTVTSLDFTLAGHQLAVATGVVYLKVPTFARVYDVPTGNPVTPPLEHPNAITGIRFHYGEASVITACLDGQLRTWDTATAKVTGEPMKFPAELSCMTANKNRDVLAVGSGKEIYLVFVPGMRVLGTPLPQNDMTLGLAFDPTQQLLITGGIDRLLRVWNWSTREIVGVPLLHQNYVKSLAFSPDGLSFISGSEDKHLRIVDLPLQAMMGIPVDKTDRKLILRDISRNLVSGRPRTSVTGHVPESIPHWTWDYLSASFSADGRYTVTGSSDQHGYVWDLKTGDRVGQPLTHVNWVRTVAFHPDSRRVATGSHDSTARIWDAQTGKPLTPPLITRAEVSWVEFSHDGSLLLSIAKKTVQLWNTETGTLHGSPMVHPEIVTSGCLSPDGRMLATAFEGTNPRIQFWDAKSTRPLGPPLACLGMVTAMRFEEGDRTLLTCSNEGITRRWELPSDEIADSESLRLLPQVVTGQKFAEGNVQVPLESAEHHALRSRLLALRSHRNQTVGGSASEPADDAASPRSGERGYEGFDHSPDLIHKWHDRQAASTEIIGDGAATFHQLKHVIQTRNNDWTLYARYSAALHRYGIEPETSERWQQSRERASLAALRDWCAERALQKERVNYAIDGLWFRQKAVELDGDNLECRTALGHCFARLGRFTEAKEHFEKAVALAPQRADGLRDLAMVQLALEDRSAYRAACQRLLDLAKATDDIEVAYITALTCVLDPDCVKDWSPIVALASRCAAAYEGDRPLFIAAMYRSGRYDADLIYKENTTQVRFTHNVWEWFFQGMLQVKAGQVESGQTILREKLEMVNLMDTHYPRDPLSKVWSNWIYHVQCHTLADEAKSLK